MIKFRDNIHKERYYDMISNMQNRDSYHRAVAYLFSLDDRCYEHLSSIFDYSESRSGRIKPDTAYDGRWHNSTSLKTLRLAYNLWNGCVESGEENLYSPTEIFRCDLAPYYMEAIKLRFPEYFRDD